MLTHVFEISKTDKQFRLPDIFIKRTEKVQEIVLHLSLLVLKKTAISVMSFLTNESYSI